MLRQACAQHNHRAGQGPEGRGVGFGLRRRHLVGRRARPGLHDRLAAFDGRSALQRVPGEEAILVPGAGEGESCAPRGQDDGGAAMRERGVGEGEGRVMGRPRVAMEGRVPADAAFGHRQLVH